MLLSSAGSSWPIKKVCEEVTDWVEDCDGLDILWNPTCPLKPVTKLVCNNPNPSIYFSTYFSKSSFENKEYSVSSSMKDVNSNIVNSGWVKVIDLASSFLPADIFVPIFTSDILVPIYIRPRDEEIISVIMTLNNISIFRSSNLTNYNKGIKNLIYSYDINSKVTKSRDIAFCKTINNVIDVVHNTTVNTIHKLENELASYNNELIQKQIDLRGETIKAIEELRNITNLIIDINQMLIQEVSPIKSFLLGWRDELDEAMLQYTLSASQSMLNTTDKNVDTPYQPMINWFNNYHMALISGVKVNGVATSTTKLIEALRKIKQLSKIDPLGELIDKEIIKLEEKAKNLIKQKLVSEFNKFLPDELKQLMDILTKSNLSASELNVIFTTPESGEVYKGLIMMPDIADRVQSEMYILDGKYNKDKYSVIGNSIILSKLALLDKEGLKTLALHLGIPVSSVENLENLVKGAFHNIDANHQWMPISPPIPRDSGFSVINSGKSWANEGLTYCSSSCFFLWGVGENNTEIFRDSVFRSIFKGPISPGIDSPEMFGFPEIVTDDYNRIYNPTLSNPFPSN